MTVIHPDRYLNEIARRMPELTGREPADVLAYAKQTVDSRKESRFPHEATADQWFSESQFESYRQLGQWVVEEALSYYENWKGESAVETSEPCGLVHALSEVAQEMQRNSKVPELAGGVVYKLKEDNTYDFLLVDSVDRSALVLPKGHVEQGEKLKETAVREVLEETGYSFTDQQAESFQNSTFIRDGKTVRVGYFLLRCSAEHEAARKEATGGPRENGPSTGSKHPRTRTKETTCFDPSFAR